MITLYYYTSEQSLTVQATINGESTPMYLEKYPSRYSWVFGSAEGLSDFSDGSETYSLPEPGEYAVYRGRLIKQECTKDRIMLVSDLDNTLVADLPRAREALSRLTDYWIKHHLFTESRLVYNTGRNFNYYMKLFDEGYDLLEPDMVINAVGSRAFTVDTKTGKYVEHPQLLDLYDLTHWNSEIVEKMQKDHFPWLEEPFDEKLQTIKMWGTAPIHVKDQHIGELKKLFRNEENIEYYGMVIKGKIIVSEIEDFSIIDITALGGGKKVGVKFAQDFFGFNDKSTLLAGDSGNDIEMFKSNNHGVIVGNHTSGLGSWFRRKGRPTTYISQLFFGDALIEALEKIS